MSIDANAHPTRCEKAGFPMRPGLNRSLGLEAFAPENDSTNKDMTQADIVVAICEHRRSFVEGGVVDSGEKR
jgi:hypothetical protein